MQEYLDAYDRQLRADTETPSAVAVTRLGPLRLVTFAGGRGFVTYRDLGGADGRVIARWVEGALAHYREDPGITRVEWKTRAHDHAPALHDALVQMGSCPGPESIMIGEANLLAVDVPLPKGIHLRRVTSEAGRPRSVRWEGIAGRVRRKRWQMRCSEDWGSGMEWNSGWQRPTERSSTGRLEPVPATEFAGIWAAPRDPGVGAGSGRSAARARSALGAWQETDPQRLDRSLAPDPRTSGLIKVSTTTPYLWVAGG